MMQFRSGAIVRWNVTDDSVNRGIVDANGTVLNWIGAARIRDTLAEERFEKGADEQAIKEVVAREIAAAYSGTLEIGDGRLGGARLTLRLPGR